MNCVITMYTQFSPTKFYKEDIIRHWNTSAKFPLRSIHPKIIVKTSRIPKISPPLLAITRVGDLSKL